MTTQFIFFNYLKADISGVVQTRDYHLQKTLNSYVRGFELIRKISKIGLQAE